MCQAGIKKKKKKNWGEAGGELRVRVRVRVRGEAEGADTTGGAFLSGLRRNWLELRLLYSLVSRAAH
jgi:hypothetical protein